MFLLQRQAHVCWVVCFKWRFQVGRKPFYRWKNLALIMVIVLCGAIRAGPFGPFGFVKYEFMSEPGEWGCAWRGGGRTQMQNSKENFIFLIENKKRGWKTRDKTWPDNTWMTETSMEVKVLNWGNRETKYCGEVIGDEVKTKTGDVNEPNDVTRKNMAKTIG